MITAEDLNAIMLAMRPFTEQVSEFHRGLIEFEARVMELEARHAMSSMPSSDETLWQAVVQQLIRERAARLTAA